MKTGVMTMPPRYGYILRGSSEKMPKPRVYSTTHGYRIEPWWHLKGGGTDDLTTVIEGEFSGWLLLGMWLLLALVFPVGLVVWFLVHRKYERQFWIKNGFDPDSFS